MGKYDKSKTLIIDPVLIFATYNAAFSDNFEMTATYGYDGSAYAGGMVYGNNYPMPSGTAYDINSNFTVLNGAYGVRMYSSLNFLLMARICFGVHF